MEVFCLVSSKRRENFVRISKSSSYTISNQADLTVLYACEGAVEFNSLEQINRIQSMRPICK